ncbi:hypothetical protein ABC345_13795 [Shouchella sp. 1P09AA]|uniref:hypothetical protein n=1 Tax=Bacillaceae TaxID=186817 RepID=UPI000C08C67D|nr:MULTISPECIES: hypothetical protein [Bacillaceae]UTR05246.1 hypothetical protein MM326_14165 [Alkalihalobacillus sp. LMS6]
MLYRWFFSLVALVLLAYSVWFMFQHPMDTYGFRGFRFFLFMLHVSIFLYGIDLIRNRSYQ